MNGGVNRSLASVIFVSLPRDGFESTPLFHTHRGSSTTRKIRYNNTSLEQQKGS